MPKHTKKTNPKNPPRKLEPPAKMAPPKKGQKPRKIGRKK